MKIALHAGAHFTEENRLCKTILRNKPDLSRRRILVPGPSRYRTLLRDTLLALHTQDPGHDTRALLLEEILNDETGDRLILSHPGIFGTPQNCIRNGMLYHHAPLRMAQLEQVFEDDPLELFLAVRDPASFLPAVYAALPTDQAAAFMSDADPREIRWSETIYEIREAAPEVKITLWCFEDLPLIWAEVVRAICGLEPNRKIVGGFDLLGQIMSAEGMQRFRTYLKEHPTMSELQKRRVIEAFLERFAVDDALEEVVDAPGWSEDLIAELGEIYDRDMAVCREIPGVSFISP